MRPLYEDYSLFEKPMPDGVIFHHTKDNQEALRRVQLEM